MENYLGNWVNQKEHCKPSHQKLTETIVKITSRRKKKKKRKKKLHTRFDIFKLGFFLLKVIKC